MTAWIEALCLFPSFTTKEITYAIEDEVKTKK